MVLLVEQKLLFFRNSCVHPWFAMLYFYAVIYEP
jgi:hypothetical protein